MFAIYENETKVKAKDRRKAQQELSTMYKNSKGHGEEIPVQKGYKRTKMKFI